MKAYKTKCPKISEGWGIVKSESASKARYRSYLSASDAGFDISITDIVALRASEFDDATYCGEPMPVNQPFGLEYLEINADA